MTVTRASTEAWARKLLARLPAAHGAIRWAVTLLARHPDAARGATLGLAVRALVAAAGMTIRARDVETLARAIEVLVDRRVVERTADGWRPVAQAERNAEPKGDERTGAEVGPIDLLTSHEVADFLRTSQAAVRIAARRGLIPRPIRLPGVGLRWLRADLSAWVHAHAQARESEERKLAVALVRAYEGDGRDGRPPALKKAAAAVGVSPKRAAGLLRQHNLATRDHVKRQGGAIPSSLDPRTATTEDEAAERSAALAAFAEGLTVRELAAMLGTSLRAVSCLLRAAGIVRRRGRPKKTDATPAKTSRPKAGNRAQKAQTTSRPKTAGNSA